MSLSATDLFERFDIEFDAGPEPYFHGGELITGALKINLKQKVTIRAIRIQFKGRACWLGDTTKGAEVEKVYFDKDFVLLERPPGKPEPGHFDWIANFTYSLPFQFQLPKGCATSYEGPQAFIRYFARATLITDEVDASQYISKKGFTVVAPPELHQLLPPASDPVEVDDVTTFGSCCCRGKVTTKLSLPKSAYAPGEKIVGTFTVNNKHPKQILDQVEVRLIDRVVPSDGDGTPVHRGRGSIENRTLVLRKLEKEDGIKAKSQLTLDHVHFLTVPAVAPSTQQSHEARSVSPPQSPDIRLQRDGPASQLLESPSSLTLKQRKKPFLKLGYALQVSLGPRVLLEVPLNIHPIPLYAHGVEFQPFVAGTQNFHEADETDKKPLKTPFEYVPRYPVYTTEPTPTVALTSGSDHELSVTANGDVELNRSVEISDLPNGDRVILTKEEIVIVHNNDSGHSGAPSPSPHREQTTESTAGQVEVVPEDVPQEDHQQQRDLVREKRPEPEDIPEPSPETTTEPEATPEVEATPETEAEPEQSEDTEIPETQSEPIIEEPEDPTTPEGHDGSEVVHEETRVTTTTDEDGEHTTTIVTHDVNGGVKTVTTEEYEEGDHKVQKTVENYEYTDENGVRVEVQKTVEQTLVPSEVHVHTSETH
uniref:Arrestin_C domain-containing protein n=1 Tax=Panagrellus redivivus TaxID=6233 RepID=A0A7E4W8Q5_PANRE